MLMPPVWTISLLAYGQAQQQTSGSDWLPALYPIAVFSLLTGGVYIQNQVHDIESDKANCKLFLLTDGYISVRAANLQTLLCYGAAVVLAFVHSIWLGSLMSLYLLLGNQYNIPPFRWKDRPNAGLLYNVIVYGTLTYVMGWMAAAPPDYEMVLQSIPYCLGVGAIYLNTTLPDIPGDRAAGKITIDVRHGFKISAVLACVMLSGAVLTGWWLDDPYIAVPSLLALPLFLRMPVTGRVDDVARATKVGVLVLALAAVVVYPPYLGLLIVLFFGSRPYYKYRFGITYPSFQVQR